MRHAFQFFLIVSVFMVGSALPVAAQQMPLNPGVDLSPAPGGVADVAPSESEAREYIAGGGAEDYLLGPQDLLKIDVFQVEEFSRTVRISAGGKISLPLVGTLQAAGLTTAQLERVLAEKLAEGFLQEPYVSVFVEEYASQRVTVEGQVRKPGIYALRGRTTLLQAVALAEGTLDLADVEKVQVFRPDPAGSRQVHYFDLDSIRAGTTADPVLQGDDLVVIQKAGMKSFFKSVTDTLRGFVLFGASL